MRIDVEAEIAGLKERVAVIETMTRAQGHSGRAIPTVTIRSVIDATAGVFGIGEPWILSLLRRPDIVVARQAAMYLAWRLTSCSLPQIGRAFRRDHTTVLHAIRKIGALEREDQAFAARLLAVVARIPNAQLLREISA